MTSSEVARRREIWLRVFNHEISRRRTIQKEKPKAYKKLFSANPKRLDECCTGEHVWVPATTLWIHDNVGRGSKIDGFTRRGLAEAAPFESDGFRYIPQMCWYCAQTREKIIQVMSWSERQKSLADHIAADARGKPRGKQGRDVMLDDLDELFG